MDSLTARKNLAKARSEMRYTQLNMSELLDISLPAYRRLEKGGTRIINKNYEKAAILLGKSLERMLTVDEDDEQPFSAYLSEGRWDIKNELAKAERQRLEEQAEYEKRLDEKDKVISRLLGIIDEKEKEVREKEETIKYQIQKIADCGGND